MDNLNEERSSGEIGVPVFIGESNIVLHNRSIARAIMGDAYDYLGSTVVSLQEGLERPYYTDDSCAFYQHLLDSARSFLGGMEVQSMTFLLQNVSEPDHYAMYVECRTRLREVNELVHLLNDRYDMGLCTVQLDFIDNVHAIFGGNIDVQSGELDHDEGAIANHKRASRNKYARKQYRHKQAIRAEREKVLTLSFNIDRQIKDREAKREQLAKAKLRSDHSKNLIPVHQELRRTILYSQEIKALKSQEKKARSCLNAKRHGVVRNAYEEAEWKRELQRQRDMEKRNVERALQYLEFTESMEKLSIDIQSKDEFESPTFDIQAGEDTKSVFKTLVFNLLQKTCGVDDIGVDKVLYQVEHIFDTLLLMYHSKTWLWALYQLKVYLTTTFEISLAYKAYDYISALFTTTELTVDIQAGDKADESRFNFKKIFGDWKGILYGEFLSKVTKAVACLVTLGFCSMSQIPFCTQRFERFHKESGIAKQSWPDLITCVIETVIFVFERCVNWFTGKCNFMDIIRSPSSAYSYDKEFAFLSANIGLYELNELDKLSIQRHEYEARLEDMMTLTKSFYEKANGPEKRVMSLNMRELHRLQTKVICSTQAMTLREAPFSFYLYGLSGIGKTAMTNILVNALSRANGFNPDKKYICSINASDAYQSELQPWHTTIFCDDLGNTKAEHELGCSTQLVIDYVNNNPKCALKADVDSKGKVLIKPKIFCATTNVKEVEAHVKSNEPLSILRRLNICITMVVRPEFRKPGSHFLDPNKMTAAINDAWLFTLEEATPIARADDALGASQHHWTVLKFGDKPLKDVDINTLLRYLITRSKEHFTQQTALLHSIDAIHEEHLCPHNSYSTVCDICSLQDVEIEVQAGEMVVYERPAITYLQSVRGFWYYLYDWQPRVFSTQRVSSFYNRYIRSDDPAQCNRRAHYVTMASTVMTTVFTYMIGSPLTLMFIAIVVSYSMSVYYYMICFLNDMLERARQQALVVMQPLIQNKYKVAAGLSAAVMVVAIVKRLRPAIPLVKHAFDTQGATHMTPQPDAIQKENVWVKAHVEQPPRTMEVSTTTFDQLDNVVQDCIASVRLSFIDKELTNVCCALPVCGNTWIMPFHALRKGFDYVDIIRRGPGVSSNRKCRISKSSWIRIGDSDLALISLPSAGDNRNLLPYFPNGKFYAYEPVKWIHRDTDAIIKTDEFMAQFKDIDFVDKKGDHYRYDGWQYNMAFASGTGMCMATLISKGKYPYIMGFHSAGADGTPVGLAHYLRRDDIKEHLDKLYTHTLGDSGNINVQVHSSGTMNLDFHDYNIKHLGSLHDKSPFRHFEKNACAILYGAHNGTRRRFRSEVVPTLISESVEKHLGISRKHGPPMNISNWKPWQADAQAVTTSLDMDIDILSLAYTDLELHIHQFLDKHQHYKEVICPMSRVATLSGVDGCRGIDAIKLSTSAGFPRCKPKRNYVFESEDEHENITRPLDVSPEIWEDIENIKDTLAKGERVYFIHRINLKDEPTKIGKEKVRTFAGCTLECLILIRMYFLPIAKMMMDNTEVFECAIGVNAHGPDWTRLTEHMQKHGAHRTIAGDYRSFDSMMWCFIVLLAFNIMIGIAEWAGYSQEQIIIMRGIATELAYGLTEYNGEYAMFLAQNLSGHGLTVFINNLANQLYMRFAYYDIYMAIVKGDMEWLHGLQIHLALDDDEFSDWKKTFMILYDDEMIAPFAENVALICYGDDNKMSVHERINFFNHCTVSYSLSRCGVTYTMADKESKSVPFIHSSECSFLKRHSVWDEEFQQYLAPLELDSLVKTLHACVRSKELSEQQQAAEALDSVVRELFYHGRDTFDDWRSKLQLVVDECGLNAYFKTRQLHTYEFLKSEYVTKYLSNPDIKHDLAAEPFADFVKNGLLDLDTQCSVICKFATEYKAFPSEGIVSFLGQSSPAQETSPHIDHNLKQYVVSVQVSETQTQDKVNNISSMMGPQQHQNVVFRDGTPQWSSSLTGAYDETRTVAMDKSVPLDEFFGRPVKFDLPSWTPGSAIPYSTILTPWLDFFTNKRVANRISNFALLQATMKVKIVINGNPFYYGRLMADYAPLRPLRTMDSFNTLNRANLVSASQRSHIYINPTTSQGGILELPFIWPANAINLTSPSDLARMGDINIREVNPLKHANASTTPVSLTAYVWAENVVMSVPTTHNSVLLGPQARDEYSGGPVSNLATSVAKASGMLQGLPVIGPYARATTMAAGAVGNVAKMMGFSRPSQIENNTKVYQKVTSNMATTDTGDSSEKLAVDSKQELTIDPRVVGLDTGDELDIVSIASKESYLTTFTWPIVAVSDQLLWNTRVSPSLAVRDLDFTVDQAYQLPACTFAAYPFQYWRGTMQYRFQIVASEYHRGRLKIIYDPLTIFTGTQGESNLAFERIVDISSEQDFTIEVSWGQAVSYLEHDKSLTQISSQDNYGTLPLGFSSSRLRNANGVLAVYVINDLTSPNSVVNNDVQINVSVSMCDDAEFQVLSNDIVAFSFNPQAGEEMSTDAQVDEEDNAPTSITANDSILTCLKLDHTNSVYFGESITNFRTLFKRYTFYRSYLIPELATAVTRFTVPDFPFYRGVSPTGFDNLANANTGYVVKTALVSYIASAFLAMRGGFRWKYQYVSDQVLGTGAELSVARIPNVFIGGRANQYDVTSVILGPIATPTIHAIATDGAFPSGMPGMALSTVTQQPILEVECPNYNMDRFTVPKRDEVAGAYSPWVNWHRVYVRGSAVNRHFVNAYVSTAEDFNLHGFQGCPPICIRSTFTV